MAVVRYEVHFEVELELYELDSRLVVGYEWEVVMKESVEVAVIDTEVVVLSGTLKMWCSQKSAIGRRKSQVRERFVVKNKRE